MSSRLRPWRARNPSTSPLTLSRISCGTSLESTMWNPESRRSNPMASSEFGKQKAFRREDARPDGFAAGDHHARCAISK